MTPPPATRAPPLAARRNDFAISTSVNCGLPDDFGAGEEVSDLDRGVLRRIGAVHGVGLHRFGEVLADGSRGGIGRVGGAHDLAIPGDGALAFQHLHHHRARGHERAKAFEERPLLVHAVEVFGLAAGHPDALLGHNAQALVFEPGVDLAGQVPSGGVRLDDRESAFDGHVTLLAVCIERVGAPYKRRVLSRQAGWTGAAGVLNAAAPCFLSTTSPSATASPCCSTPPPRPLPTA